eukprot:g47221.t1
MTKKIDEDRAVDVAYINFSKAFDKIPHGTLVSKVRSRGIHGELAIWIQNWLEENDLNVNVAGMVSNFADDTKIGDVMDSEEGYLRVQQNLIRWANGPTMKGMKQLKMLEPRTLLRGTSAKLIDLQEAQLSSFVPGSLVVLPHNTMEGFLNMKIELCLHSDCAVVTPINTVIEMCICNRFIGVDEV